jgi:hypothetical protein
MRLMRSFDQLPSFFQGGDAVKSEAFLTLGWLGTALT